MVSGHFQGKPFNITIIQVYAPTTDAKEAEAYWFCEDIIQDLLELTPKKKDVLFIIWDWSAKIVSQDTPGKTGKFGLGVQNEARQRLTILSREHTSNSKYSFSNHTRDNYTNGHHQMVNTEIRLIIFFEAKDGKTLYSQQKQDLELTVT